MQPPQFGNIPGDMWRYLPKKQAGWYPRSELGQDGLCTSQVDTTKGGHAVYVPALPHKGQDFSATVSFKFNVTDQTVGHFAGVLVAVASDASALYVVGVDNDSATLKFRLLRLNLSDRTFTEIASTPIQQIPNNQEFTIHVEYQNGSITAVLSDGTNQYQLTGTIQGAVPLFGIWHNMSPNQGGSVCTTRYTVSFNGQPNVTPIVAAFGPDYNDNYDWFGNVGHVWWERDDGVFDLINPNDGCQYFTVRDHEEVNPNAEETGVNVHLVRVCGDPRDPNNWEYVRRIFSRDQVNAHWLEEFELYVFRDGTWLAIGTVESFARVLVSNDQGQTWNVLGQLQDQNGNTLNKRIHGFPYNPQQTIFTVGHVGQPPEYVDIYIGNIYDIRNGNLTVQHVSHIDGVNELAIYPSNEGDYIALGWARENAPEVLGGFRYRLYAARLSNDLQTLTLGQQILPDDEYILAPAWYWGIGHTLFAVLQNNDGTRTLFAAGELIGRDLDPDDDTNDDEETHTGMVVYELGTANPPQPPSSGGGGEGGGGEEAQPRFSIVSLKYPGVVKPGSAVAVSVGVQNTGDADGNVEVRIKDSQGNTVATSTATIPAGQSTTLNLTFTAPTSPGLHVYTVEAYNTTTSNTDDVRQFTISVQSTTKTGILKWIIGGGAALLVIVLLARRKKK